MNALQPREPFIHRYTYQNGENETTWRIQLWNLFNVLAVKHRRSDCKITTSSFGIGCPSWISVSRPFSGTAGSVPYADPSIDMIFLLKYCKVPELLRAVSVVLCPRLAAIVDMNTFAKLSAQVLLFGRIGK